MPIALVVDDSEDVRLLLATVLGSEGFDVVEAGGGEEALRMTRAALVPDVIVLDVQMPGLDGWDTLTAIRASPRFADVPVVLCTVKSSVPDRLRGWKLGCDGYLVKPFDIEELVHEVRNAITQRAARNETRWRFAR